MFKNLTIDGVIVILSLLEIVVMAIAFAAYSYINHRIVKAHKGDELYKKEKTIKLFGYIFMLLALLFLSIALNFFFAAYWLICLVLTFLTGVSVYTVWQFYMQLAIFQERRIPERDLQKYRDEAVASVKRDFAKELKKISPEAAEKVFRSKNTA